MAEYLTRSSSGMKARIASMSAVFPAAELDWTLDLQARWEDTSTPSGNPAADPDYDFSSLRGRLGLDAKGERWSIHAIGQWAGSYGLPADGAFGIGPVYFGANGGDPDPTDLGLLELAATYQTDALRVTLGRQAWADGAETMNSSPRRWRPARRCSRHRGRAGWSPRRGPRRRR